MRVQRALAAGAVLVVAGLAMTACQDDVSGSAGTGGGQAASAPSGAKAPAGTGGGSSAGGAGAKAPAGGGAGAGRAAVASCATDNLIPDVSVGNATPPEADMRSVTVSFVNKGGTCTLYGFAGVNLVTSEGATDVPRGFQQPGTVTLAKGQGSTFTIWYRTNPDGHPGAKVTTMTITPPGETHSVKMNWPGEEFATGADAGGTDTLYLEPVGKNG
ncbi:DUF4232 domain-containing protein [Kitasatospora sp. NPDC052896]|uniref:DUF4232 domain-containing protein n=1 Tax=Kitasatospora sp. NPDC052896 TaxID=3364061 RepID=UPI0037C68627